MKMLYIKISPCFTYPFQKCIPTNYLNAYNNAQMGLPLRGRAQQACSVVLATSFVDRQNGLCATIFLEVRVCIHVQRFYVLKITKK